MYRVLIVDDEPSARLGLRDCFNWTRFECELVGDAEDGKKALLQMEPIPADIVITDVKMPNMDGVTLAKEIAIRYPETKVIIISGYGEIDYLKAAIKASAVDYILKPINLSEFEAAVQKAVESLGKARLQKNSIYQMDIKLLQSMPLLKEKFLMTLIRDDIRKNSELEERMHYLNIKFPISERASVVVVSLDREEEMIAEREYQRLSFAILNICQELLEQYYSGYCFESERGEYVCIVSLGEKDESGLRCFSEEIKQSLCKYLQLGVTLSIGRIVGGIAELRECYLSAMSALERKLFLGKNQVIETNEIDDAEDGGGRFNHSLTQKLTDCMKVGDYVGTKKLTETFFDYLREKKTMSLKYAQSMCLFLLFIPGRVVAEEALETEAFSCDRQEQYEELCRLETIYEMQSYILNNYRILCEYITQYGSEGNVIRSIKKSVEDRYSHNLTIKELAAEVYLSPTYLSYLFKQRTGFTINDYITSIRIDKAKEMLKDPKNNLYNIAHAVGYHEPAYFSRIFKKYTGKSPSKYRESL